MSLRSQLGAAACLAAITLNLSFWVLLLLLLLPARALTGTRPWFRRQSHRIYRAAVRVDNTLLRRISGAVWSAPELRLDRAHPHIVLANHRSWADIFIVQAVVATRGPIVNFLCKRELLYLPIVGLIILAFDFPVLRRRAPAGADQAARRREDRQRVREAAAALGNAPAAILSFAEGTRFTPAKHEAAGGPYRHLLPPRSGGLAAMIEALADTGGSIVDLTIAWPNPVSFWQFLGGGAGTVGVRWDLVPIADVPPEQARSWLNARWKRKDDLLARASATGNDPAASDSRP